MRLIIDCDPGNGIPATDVDDGLAIALALADPQIDLEAITIVSGNTPRDVGYAVTSWMMSTIGENVPVHAGAAKALLEPAGPWDERRQAKLDDPSATLPWEGFDGPDLSKVPSRFDGAETLARAVAEAPGEVTVVAIGPLTNVAMAMQLYPDFARDVKHLVIMGGAFNVPDFLQELNFGVDPEAAQQVLASGAKITLLPLDVTSETIMTPEDLVPLNGTGSPLAQFVFDTTAPWIDYCIAERGQRGMWLHDPLAVALLIDPSVVQTTPLEVDVQLSGMARSRPIGWNRETLRMHAGLEIPARNQTNVVTSADNHRLVKLICDSIAR